MKNHSIVISLIGLAFIGFVGCARGVKTATILPPDGSTGSKSSPAAKETDETIVPKSDTPPAPATPSDPTTPPAPATPPALPTSPKAPETPPAPPPSPAAVTVTTAPADGVNDAPVTTILSVTFSEPMESVKLSMMFEDGTTTGVEGRSGKASSPDNKTFTFGTIFWSRSNTYVATVTGQTSSPKRDVTYTWSFTTEGSAAVAPPPPAKVTAVNWTRPHTVGCEGYSCDGYPDTGGVTKKYLCPSGFVVTGYEIGSANYNIVTTVERSAFGVDAFAEDETIVTPVQVVGGLKIRCSRLTPDFIDPDMSIYASFLPDGSIQAGTGRTDDLIDGCDKYSGVATGFFGRSGDRLDSFGLFCGAYSRTDTSLYVSASSPVKKNTTSSPDVPFGGAPGLGGAHEFSTHCPENEAVVGISLRSNIDVHGGVAIECAELEPVF